MTKLQLIIRNIIIHADEQQEKYVDTTDKLMYVVREQLRQYQKAVDEQMVTVEDKYMHSRFMENYIKSI